MPQTIDQIIASRKSLYDPQRALAQQQISALPGQQAAAEAGLDTAKANAFNDINTGANSRGMLYSGAPIAEQNRYVGEKYLPAKANLATTLAGNRSKLESALLGINTDEANQAQQIQGGQIKNEVDANYRAQQLAIAQARADASIASSNARSARTPAATPADNQKQFNGLLTSAFDGYDPKNKTHQFYTEKSVIPYLVAQTGLPADQVAKQVYAYRQARFGE